MPSDDSTPNDDLRELREKWVAEAEERRINQEWYAGVMHCVNDLEELIDDAE